MMTVAMREGTDAMTESLDKHDRRFVCLKGESLNSIVARWAAEAHIERMLDITRVAGAVWGQRPSASAADLAGLTALADVLGIDVDELIYRAIPATNDLGGINGRRSFFGIDLCANLIETKRRYYSPMAFASSNRPYHRALWDLRLLPVCVETGEILLTACQNPICEGVALGWRQTLGIDRCEHCMADLSRSVSKSIPADLLLQIRQISDLFVPDRRTAVLKLLPAELRMGDGQLAVDLLLRLLPVANPLLKKFYASPAVEPLALCKALAECWSIILNWPRGFQEYALPRLEARRKPNQDGNHGQTVRFVKGRGPNMSTSLKDAISDIRNSMHYDGPDGEAVKAKTITNTEAAAALGLRSPDIANLRRNKHLRSVMVLVGGKLQVRYDRSEIGELREGMINRIGFERLRLRFGISHLGLEQIAALHLIEVQREFFFQRYGILQSTKQSVKQFEERLKRASLSRLPEDALSLSKVICCIGGIKPWGPVFDNLLRGKIPFYLATNSQPMAKRIYIASSDLTTLRELEFTPPHNLEFAFSTKISRVDAMEILNIGPLQASKVFADVPTTGGLRNPNVDVERVSEIASRCITVREIALRLGLSFQAVMSMAKILNIPAIRYLGYCRSTAEALLFR